MELDPDTTSRFDQIAAAVRDLPDALPLRFDSAVLDFLVEMNRRGIPPEQLHGLMHGLLAESMKRLAPQLERRST